MITAASCAATRRNISSLPSRPVRFRTFAPASRQARATAGRYVSTDTTMPVSRSALIMGSSLEFCPASSARAACAKVDSAPRSTMFAPCARKTFARDRKSTRLNSSHGYSSYAVSCIKKKTRTPSYAYNKKNKHDESKHEDHSDDCEPEDRREKDRE